MNPDFNMSVAIVLLRAVTGILFFFQGYDKIFNIKIDGVVQTFGDSVKKSIIPVVLLKPLVLISSYAEFICGALLALGLFRDFSLYFLAADLVFVAIAFSSIKAMWDMHFFFPRIVFISALLILPESQDLWSLDALLLK